MIGIFKNCLVAMPVPKSYGFPAPKRKGPRLPASPSLFGFQPVGLLGLELRLVPLELGLVEASRIAAVELSRRADALGRDLDALHIGRNIKTQP